MAVERDREPGGGSDASPAPPGGREHLGYVAHEVRNRLAAALWSAELLGRLAPGERAGSRGIQLAQRTHRALQRLARLLEDHLLSERIAAGELQLHLEDVPLGEALAEAASRLGGAPPGEPPGAGLLLRADRGLLVRALEAALARAGREGAAVRVGAEAAGATAVVTVEGAPVATDELVPPGRGAASDPEGRSLGLPTACEVARAHGGALEVASGALRLSWPRAARG